MTVQEALEILHGETREDALYQYDREDRPYILARAERMAIQALEEVEQYRVFKEIFESQFSSEALKILNDKKEFTKWLERGKWSAIKCDELNRKVEQYRALGTLEELKEAKEKQVVEKIKNGIKASNTRHDNYMTGLRNGMRWCLSLVDGKEPIFEKCNSWIPCEIETPKTNGVYQTVRKVIEGDTVYYLEGASYFDGQSTWHNDICVNHGREYLTNIVAWQPIQPYKKEGAEND